MSATELKQRGNEAFQSGNFTAAIDFFTQAIAIDPSNHIFYSNRSGAHASLNQYQEALNDAEKAIEIKPDWFKGYSRKATALQFLRRFDEAEKAFEDGLKQCPEHPTLTSGLETMRKERANFSFQQLFGDLIPKIATNPRLSKYLEQPDFVTKIQQLSTDPNSLANHLADPRIQEVLAETLGIRVQSPGSAPPPSAAPAPEPEPQPEPEPEPEPETPEQQAAREKQGAFLAAKEAGNAAYKKKQFEEALEHYGRAAEIDGENMTIYMNRAAVLLEQGKLEECVAECNRAIEVGRAHLADFALIARAFARMGNAYMKMERLEDAIDAYQRSLTENRSRDVKQRLDAAERKLRAKKEQEYLSPELAEEERLAGNEHFKNSQYPEAIRRYDEAIKRNPNDARTYSNRAACFMKLCRWQDGLKDCDEALRLDPSFVKAHTRKGHIHFFLKQYHKALEDYEAGLALDPESQECKEGEIRTFQAIQASQRSGEVDEEQIRRAQADPEIQAILADPAMNRVIQDIQTNPEAAREHLRNPKIVENINKLVAAGIMRVG